MSLWDIVTDAGLLGALLLIGQFLRAKVKFFQSILMPASLIGGFIGLALGPSGFHILPFSAQLTKYAGVLISVVFAATPIGDKPISKKDIKGRRVLLSKYGNPYAAICSRNGLSTGYPQ